MVIKVDSCELLDKLLLNLLIVIVNCYDWVRKIKFEERINLILEWIEKEKKDFIILDICFVVLIVFFG